MVLFPAAIYSKGFVELSGGINMLSMSDYNSSIDSANKNNQAAGYMSNLEKISFSALPELNAGLLYETKAGLFGFYLRNSALINYGNGGNVIWPDGTKTQTSNRNFSVFYSGLGVRRYFMPEENDRVNFYIGIDGGAYYFINNITNQSTYYYDGSLAFDLSEKWSSFFPGDALKRGSTGG